MATYTLFHNPKCSTSRKVDDALRAAGVDVETVLYLKTPPTKADLERLVGKLDDPVADLVRKDNRFKELGLHADDYTTKSAVIGLLLEHPELMQRPILETKDRAAIGRPPEEVVASFLG
jgi:arsenate reductase